MQTSLKRILVNLFTVSFGVTTLFITPLLGSRLIQSENSLSFGKYVLDENEVATIESTASTFLRWKLDVGSNINYVIRGKIRQRSNGEASDLELSTVVLRANSNPSPPSEIQFELKSRWEEVELSGTTSNINLVHFVLYSNDSKEDIELKDFVLVLDGQDPVPMMWDNPHKVNTRSIVRLQSPKNLTSSKIDDNLVWSIKPRWRLSIPITPKGGWESYAGKLVEIKMRLKSDTNITMRFAGRHAPVVSCYDTTGGQDKSVEHIQWRLGPEWKELEFLVHLPELPDVNNSLLSLRGFASGKVQWDGVIQQEEIPLQSSVVVTVQPSKRSVQVLGERDSELYKKSNIDYFTVESNLLSKHHNRPINISGYVVRPQNMTSQTAVSYEIHAWIPNKKNSNNYAQRKALEVWEEQSWDINYFHEDYPPPDIVSVFLIASDERGHHAFADSEFNGPWGTALVEEFIPTFEQTLLGGVRDLNRRFVTGHSSGGWSSLWLLTEYPNTFGACWSTSPDPIGFTAFHRTNIYEEENIFTNNKGEDRIFSWDSEGDCHFESLSFREGVHDPDQEQEGFVDKFFNEQMRGYEAVFSPVDKSGEPLKLFNRETGEIDKEVASAWLKYDILYRWWNDRELWKTLQNRIHLWCGDKDEFGLHLPILYSDLETDPSVDVRIIEGGCHNLSSTLKPVGRDLEQSIREEMTQHALFKGARAKIQLGFSTLYGKIRVYSEGQHPLYGFCDIELGGRRLSPGEFVALPICNITNILGPNRLDLHLDFNRGSKNEYIGLFRLWVAQLERSGWELVGWGNNGNFNENFYLAKQDVDWYTSEMQAYTNIYMLFECDAFAILERPESTNNGN